MYLSVGVCLYNNIWIDFDEKPQRNMAYPPPQGNFSYQRAYPPNYGPEPTYPPPIGFQNYITSNPNAQPSQNVAYPPVTPTTVAYHGTPEAPKLPPSDRNSLNDVPEVGFERYSRKSNQPSAHSASGVELENVEDLPHDSGERSPPDEQLSDNSATQMNVSILVWDLLIVIKMLLN